MATLELLKAQLGQKPLHPYYSSPYFRSQRPYYGQYPFSYRSYNPFYPYSPYQPYHDPTYVRQSAYYQPFVNQNEGRIPASTDETLSDEEALNNLKSLKEIYEKSDSDKRLLISTISVNSDLSSITIKTTSFLSLFSSLSSLATISVTTKTVLVPGLTIG